MVDDSPEALEIFKAILNPYGVNCDVALSGDEAVGIVKRSGDDPFDVIFVNWKMPGTDGVNTARELKTAGRSMPIVVMISSADMSGVESYAREAGVDHFMQKPLFPSALFNMINECMNHVSVPKREKREEKESDDGVFRNKRVLLAEDVKINCEILESLMEHTGIDLDYAEDGREALDKFSSAPDRYDLILMDVHMPNMDGYDATRKIRASGLSRAGTIPIIAMTANVFREDVERCRAAGMNDHIGKPIDAAEVVEKLKRYLL